MIKLKENVAPRHLVILAAVANVAERLSLTVVITSGNDGQHMPNSRHYENQALDVRSKQPFANRTEKIEFLNTVLDRLGPNYQGLLENEGSPNEHFHFEYDPTDH